ncbi:helix-turn-helix transcriptional regulator [Gordonia sp. (in: high G+C Gram-positive bacteria)]|uniref:helix-turn-helix transcriptional regulator n=1 Tax=Gordonia sp. (in: high G+C Gram-positive bacteria) TaxID=84139 RepID=UPI003342A754
MSVATYRRKKPPVRRREVWMQVKDGTQIRRRRQAKRYSQRELAFLVRRSQNTIHLIESGKLRSISEELAIAIAARLDRDWEELFIEHEVDPVMTHAS